MITNPMTVLSNERPATLIKMCERF